MLSALHTWLIWPCMQRAISCWLMMALLQWTDLMTQLSVKYPDAAARCICDFLNEPDFGNLRWEAQPSAGLPGMKDMYLNAMDAVYNVTSSTEL